MKTVIHVNQHVIRANKKRGGQPANYRQDLQVEYLLQVR